AGFSLSGGNANDYNLTSVSPAAASIMAKTASITANAASKYFGQSDPGFTGTIGGFMADDNVTASYSRNSGENVGNYLITPALNSPNGLDNYSITYNTAGFTINARPTVVHYTGSLSSNYGDCAFAISATLRDGLTGGLITGSESITIT